MSRADVLIPNSHIFVSQGKILNEVAKKSVKVVVVGNPCNTNALMAMKAAPSIPKQNFSALTRLDQNRAVKQVHLKLQELGQSELAIEQIKKVCIWGNHSNTQYPDVLHAEIGGQPLTDVLKANDDWFNKDFIQRVQMRGNEIIQVAGKSSVASAANAICDHVRDLQLGTPDGQFSSMGVISDGNPYGVTDDLVYSFPCKIQPGGNYEIVKDLEISEQQ